MNGRICRAVIVPLLLLGLTTAGCASIDTGLDSQMSETWQTRVVTIADLAAAGDVTTALSDLAGLEADAIQARSAGQISAERSAIIHQSIADVRLDLEAKLSAIQPPATQDPPSLIVEPSPADSGDDGKSGNNGNGGNGGNNGKGKDKGDG